VQVNLTAACKAHKKVFDFDFGTLDIKSRGAKGNILTKYPIRKVSQLEVGSSSLGSVKLWIDRVSGRLNHDERGDFIGKFDTGDQLIAIFKNGTYKVVEIDVNMKFDGENLIDIAKLEPDTILSCVYYEGDRGWTMVKRFLIETQTLNQEFRFISESKSSKLYYASLHEEPVLSYTYKKDRVKHDKELEILIFVGLKGWKAAGNKLGEFKLLKVEDLTDKPEVDDDIEEIIVSKKETSKPKSSQKGAAKRAAKPKSSSKKKPGRSKKAKDGDSLGPGDTIEFDF